jgi:hypothetical protein
MYGFFPRLISCLAFNVWNLNLYMRLDEQFFGGKSQIYSMYIGMIVSMRMNNS